MSQNDNSVGRAKELYDRLLAGGEQEVNNFIAQKITEELYLDYKRSADNGSGTSLHNKDKSNLAKAISGFGNSEGGLIVWGVDCRNDSGHGDVPNSAVHIENPTRFKSFLEHATSGLTVPVHSGVIHHAIKCADGDKGFVITLVPSGMYAPYQTAQDLSYYIRAGSNFSKTPHAVLAGMFGKRPQPSIKHHYMLPTKPVVAPNGTVTTQLGINLHNYGRGIAESVFLNFTLTGVPGESCSVEFRPSEDRKVWWGQVAFSRIVHLITRADYRVPPGAFVLPLSLEIKLKPPFTEAISFTAECGAQGCEMWHFAFNCEASEVQRAYEAATIGGNKEGRGADNTFNKIFFAHLNKLRHPDSKS